MKPPTQHRKEPEQAMLAQTLVPEDCFVLWAERAIMCGLALLRGQMEQGRELLWFNILLDDHRANGAAVGRFMARTKPGALPMDAERSPQGRHRRVGPWFMRRGGGRCSRKARWRRGA